MLYTRKGDKGDTGTFGCNQRMSKSSAVAEALGTLDECNSFLGVCKIISKKENIAIDGEKYVDILDWVQQNLFIVQAEVAGAPKTIEEKKVKKVEGIIASIEKELPPIKSFFISGGTELAAQLDFARTLTRRAERRVVALTEDPSTGLGREAVKIGEHTKAFLNRLSSLFYAMARFANHKSDITERAPQYE